MLATGMLVWRLQGGGSLELGKPKAAASAEWQRPPGRKPGRRRGGGGKSRWFEKSLSPPWKMSSVGKQR